MLTPQLPIQGPPGSTLTELRASPSRRFIGVGAIAALGVLVLWIAVAEPAPAIWRAILATVGIAACAAALALWRATAGALVLRPEGLFTEEGDALAPLDGIDKIERGAFAFKPSNGFSVVLTSPQPFGWRPGLWWRLGRRLGVGGVTSPGEAKAVAELLQAMMAQRAAQDAQTRDEDD